MGEVVGQLLPLAVVIAIFPIPIVAVVLMLATPRGGANGPVFVLAWVLGLAAAGTILLVLADAEAHADSDAPSSGANWIRLAIGICLITLGARKFRRRPTGDALGELPSWMSALEGFTWPRAFGAGLALSAANPKNLLLVAAGATVIAQADLPAAQQAASLAILVVLGTIGVAAPVVLYFVLGDRSRGVLDGMRTWLAANNAVIVAVLFVVIGFKILGDAISGFSA